MSRTILYACILLLGVFISAVSQVILKKAANREHGSFLKEYLNPPVIIAYVMFVGTTLLCVLAYRVIPLSMGPILEATSYIYVTIFGVLIFHERLNKNKVLAVILNLGGIAIYALLG
ncbi:MAG: multidrug ABC transporter [Lachnospiraceae bacterium]|nr:multidrug ABC transporter [Lachnospiraceae bacterium]